jgi:hypothetical protein
MQTGGSGKGVDYCHHFKAKKIFMSGVKLQPFFVFLKKKETYFELLSKAWGKRI